MGLWQDMHDPMLRDLIGRAAIDGDAAAYVRVDPFITQARAQHEQYTPTTAEGRHEALLWDVPQGSGDAESGAYAYDLPEGGLWRKDLYGVPYWTACAEPVECVINSDEEGYNPFLLCDVCLEVRRTPLLDYAQDFEAGEELMAEFASDARYDEPFADDTWYDIGTCSGCGAYGRVGLMHWGCTAEGMYL